MITIHIVDAFTKEAGKGNRAGVVFDADTLSEQEMQDIAAFANFSETAFILKPQDDTHDIHVRYFTPTQEVPICGHATVATHFVRAQKLGLADTRVMSKTGVGVLPVDIQGSGEDTKVIMTQGAPEFGMILSAYQQEKLRKALGITADDLRQDLPIQIASTGHSKVIVPMKSVEKLDSLSPDMNALITLSEEIDCKGYFPVVIDELDGKIQTFGRMFGPAVGINEDPVTGNANGPTGAYLTHHNVLRFKERTSYIGHQGIAMGKPGQVEVTAHKENGKLKTVQIAGHAVISGHLDYQSL